MYVSQQNSSFISSSQLTFLVLGSCRKLRPTLRLLPLLLPLLRRQRLPPLQHLPLLPLPPLLPLLRAAPQLARPDRSS